MLRLHPAARTAVLGLCTAVAAAAPVAADPVYQALRQAPITGAFVADNIVLHRDAGTLTLKSGTIGFTAPAMGHDTVVVFVGEGEFDLTPVPSIEKSYLKSLTDQDSVHESFDRALAVGRFRRFLGGIVSAVHRRAAYDARHGRRGQP
ncbi:MAG TPA: hypothetical protein VKX45_02455 [Bryobacteraceae bacterium]|jgi:hypothetical protein|nr:hypothetical protein [Bryobacteraceae bacterium]